MRSLAVDRCANPAQSHRASCAVCPLSILRHPSSDMADLFNSQSIVDQKLITTSNTDSDSIRGQRIIYRRMISQINTTNAKSSENEMVYNIE